MTSRPTNPLHLLPGALVPSRSRRPPEIVNRPHSIEADVTIPAGGAEGILLAQGGAAGGFAFYVKDEPAALRAQLRGPRLLLCGFESRVPEGRHKLRFEFEPTGEPDFAARQGRARPVPAVRRTATWSPMPRSRTRHRRCSSSRACPAATTPALPCCPMSTWRRSRSRERSTRSCSTCRATSSRTTRRRCAELWLSSSRRWSGALTNRTVIEAFTARLATFRMAQPSPQTARRLPKHVRYRCATPRRGRA